jgi:hypothetical protein
VVNNTHMLDIHLTSDDVARVTVVPTYGQLSEVIFSLVVLRKRQNGFRYRPWTRDLNRAVRRAGYLLSGLVTCPPPIDLITLTSPLTRPARCAAGTRPWPRHRASCLRPAGERVAAAKQHRVGPDVPTHCNPGHFCSYNNTNGTSPCFRQPTSTTYYNWPGECANEDESLNNNIAGAGYPGLTRVYYLTFEGGAYMCMNAGDYIDDVSKGHDGGAYRFDQGSGLSGYDKPIKQNIASSEIDTLASCIENE